MKNKIQLIKCIYVICFLLLVSHTDAKNNGEFSTNKFFSCTWGISDLISVMSEVNDTVVTVNNVNDLFKAVGINGTRGHVTVLLEDGIYQLTRTLYIHGPSITIRGKSGVRENVIIQGDAMSATAKVQILIRVEKDDFGLADLTLRNCGWHLLQIAGETDADRPVIDNVVFQDAYEQLMKVTYSAIKPEMSSDSGIVKNCLFEYTAGIGPQYYIGGIDAHHSKGWIISANILKNITSPDQYLPDPAIHFWSGSENTIVERNLIINCERGIGFGLGYDRGHIGGIIRNNMIYHDGSVYHDVGIGVEACPDVRIYNNTVFMKGDYPNSIELRWSLSTNGKIYNNLCNGLIQLRDTSSAELGNNVTDVDSTWFLDPMRANLNLLSTAVEAIDKGITLDDVKYDFNTQKRPWGKAYDIGADEYNGINFFASEYSVFKGFSSKLYWNINGLGNVTAYGAWSGPLALSDSLNITPDSTSVYGIYGISGVDTARFEVKIYVIPELETAINSQEFIEHAVKVYPNPATGLMTIELPVEQQNNHKPVDFQFYNANGQFTGISAVSDGRIVKLDASNLSDGSYIFVLLVDKKKVGYGKFVIAH